LGRWKGEAVGKLVELCFPAMYASGRINGEEEAAIVGRAAQIGT